MKRDERLCTDERARFAFRAQITHALATAAIAQVRRRIDARAAALTQINSLAANCMPHCRAPTQTPPPLAWSSYATKTGVGEAVFVQLIGAI